jgi:hypothetical protein
MDILKFTNQENSAFGIKLVQGQITYLQRSS